MLGDSHAKNDGDAKAKPDFKIPSEFEDEYDFLASMREDFYSDIQFDRLNREAALSDLRFTVGDQWDDTTRYRREAARKPVLTINKLPAFAAQIIGARRQNETVIKVLPDTGGDKDIAELREGLMRSIQATSRAKIAYDNALAGAVICGIGNFQVELDYESDDVFEQEIKISQIADHLAVVWDRMLVDPTGADARHCFVVETITKKDFYRKYPWATAADIVVDVTLRGDLRMNGWIAVDDVRVVDYWRVSTEPRTLALMQDGTTQDLTDVMDENHASYDPQRAVELLSQIVQRSDGSPIMREVNKKYAEMYKCSGLDILEGPYRLEIPRVPVLRVPGWEVRIQEWVHRWGLIRFLKDPQRMHNFYRSAVAEKLAQTPRGVWMAGAAAVAGREKEWRESHLTDNPLLIWNDDAANKPERVLPAQMENALMTQAEMTSQDIKDVSNIHEANLGMPSNEVSGVAIMARQRVSDVGTIIYHDNLNMAIEQAGVIINCLVPTTYDTPRIIKVEGEDGKESLVAINQPNRTDPDHPLKDITAGKYSVTVATGPSTETKRIEASENMMTLINAMPQTAAIIADLIVEAQDWPMAKEIARRLRLELPPGMIDPKTMTPEEQQATVQKAQQGAAANQVQMYDAIANLVKTQSEAAVNNARAKNFQVQADIAPAEAQRKQTDTASQAADRELRGGLEAINVAHGGQ
jgi:hypothetical protein